MLCVVMMSVAGDADNAGRHGAGVDGAEAESNSAHDDGEDAAHTGGAMMVFLIPMVAVVLKIMRGMKTTMKGPGLASAGFAADEHDDDAAFKMMQWESLAKD